MNEGLYNFLKKMVKYHCSFRRNVLMANYGKAFLIIMARKMFTLEFEKDLDFIV